MNFSKSTEIFLKIIFKERTKAMKSDYDEDEFDFDDEVYEGLTQDKIYLNEGADAYQRGDYETAIRLYKKSADMGNITALSNLGYCYYYGRSIPVDKDKARECWEKAAILGDIAAVYKLGDMYRYGDLPQNLDFSHALYKRAFILATDNSENYYVAPDAFLRMLKYYPDDISDKGYSKIEIALSCITGIKKRIAEGDNYSEKALKEAKAILLRLIDD